MIEKDSTGAKSEFQVSYSVEKAFEPVKAWQDRGATDLATSLESLERMQQSAAAALEPIKALCEHMRTLPYAFAQSVLVSKSIPIFGSAAHVAQCSRSRDPACMSLTRIRRSPRS
jgi:hypothetical protein